MASILYDETKKTIQFYKPPLTDINDMETFPLGRQFCEFLNLDIREFDKQRTANLKVIMTLEDKIKPSDRESGDENITRRESYIDFLMKNLSRVDHLYPQNITLDKTADFAKIVRQSDLLGIQQKYRMFADFCLNIECDPTMRSLTPQQRFFIMLSLPGYKDSLPKVSITTRFLPELSPDDELKYFSFAHRREERSYERVIEEIKENMYRHNFGFGLDLYRYIDSEIPKASINFASRFSASLYECCDLENIDYCLFFEFSKLVSNNMNIKICANCGRYFVLKGNYKTDFCDDVPPGQTQTCKVLGSAKRFYRKLEEDVHYREYRKAYKRYYAWIRYGKIAPDDFEEWAASAKTAYRKMTDGLILEHEYINALKTPPKLLFVEDED